VTDSGLRFPSREVEGDPFHRQVKDILNHFNIHHSHDARMLQAVQLMKEAHLASESWGHGAMGVQAITSYQRHLPKT
jgi:hypothetical protein